LYLLRLRRRYFSIKLSKNQLLAGGFVKIVMDIVLISKNITFIFWIYDTMFFSQQHSLELPYLRHPISDEISLDIRQRHS